MKTSDIVNDPHMSACLGNTSNPIEDWYPSMFDALPAAFPAFAPFADDLIMNGGDFEFNDRKHTSMTARLYGDGGETLVLAITGHIDNKAECFVIKSWKVIDVQDNTGTTLTATLALFDKEITYT
jgi:hypothetical protein